ncbi:hypothetical protein [Lichenihabitans psoromatis]|uniref:hypothetical protein n=1 Tax=Lichenihabitans psoromatis TaxID=2528642 RepID=UPI0010384007|nr:hypothetical protein [Lichenihabitans psoromatis]
MTLLTGGLAAVFGAAFGAIFADGVLHQSNETATGTGGFTVSWSDSPIKFCLDAVDQATRGAAGLPSNVVKLTVLQASAPGGIGLDDQISLAGLTYRVVNVDTDPAAVGFVLLAVPI